MVEVKKAKKKRITKKSKVSIQNQEDLDRDKLARLVFGLAVRKIEEKYNSSPCDGGGPIGTGKISLGKIMGDFSVPHDLIFNFKFRGKPVGIAYEVLADDSRSFVYSISEGVPPQDIAFTTESIIGVDQNSPDLEFEFYKMRWARLNKPASNSGPEIHVYRMPRPSRTSYLSAR